MTWEKKRIEVPAGVKMTSTKDGSIRTWPSPLQFRAKRLMKGTEPADDVWLFAWLSKIYSVPQAEVSIIE